MLAERFETNVSLDLGVIGRTRAELYSLLYLTLYIFVNLFIARSNIVVHIHTDPEKAIYPFCIVES